MQGLTTQQTFGQTATTTPATTDMFATPAQGVFSSSPAIAAITPATAITPTGFATQVTTTAVSSAQGTCGPLHLEIGPLDLNASGLVAHMDRLVVDVAATPPAAATNQTTPATAGAAASQATASTLNAGLCSIAGLVGQGQTNLQNVADLLNQVLTSLG